MTQTLNLESLGDLQLNYTVAKIKKHQFRCPWLLNEQGHAAFFGYEEAWGNPMVLYTANAAAALALAKEASISVEICDIELNDDGRLEVSGGWVARSPGEFLRMDEGIKGDTWERAVVKCFIHMHLGSEVAVDF